MVARPWSSSRLSCGERFPLKCDRNGGYNFLTKQGKHPSSPASIPKRRLLWMWAGPSCFLSSGDGYVGELLELQQGCEGPFSKFQILDVISLEKPQRKWASSRLEWRTSWIFSSCSRCSRLTTGTSGTRSGCLRKGQSPCELLGGLSGFLSRRCRGLRPCVESVPEPEDSSPVLTWILGYFWSLPRVVSPPLEWGHARALSSQL